MLMKTHRTVMFKVCAINIADHEITIFQHEDYTRCESFALAYDGDHKEVFIKKVFVAGLGRGDTYPVRPGTEL